jgi:hypothetical protein
VARRAFFLEQSDTTIVAGGSIYVRLRALVVSEVYGEHYRVEPTIFAFAFRSSEGLQAWHVLRGEQWLVER